MNLLNLKLINHLNPNLKTCKYYYLKYLKQFINFKFLVQKYEDLAKVMDNYRSKTRKKMVHCTLFIENERFLHPFRTIF